MSLLKRAMEAVNAAESLLQTDFSPGASLAKVQLQIARVAIREAQKQESPVRAGDELAHNGAKEN